MNEPKPEDVMRELELQVQRHLMPNVDIDGTVRVEDAERWFLKLLKEHLAPYISAILREKNAEIERLTRALELSNAEREANVKGFTEELQDTIARYKGVIRILEQDIATRDKIIEGKIEEAFPEFMRDYKQLQKEYSELRDEIVDRYVEMCKRAFNFGETILEKSICDILCKVAKDLKEVSQ